MSISREGRVILANAIVVIAFLSIIEGHIHYDRRWRTAFETGAIGDTEKVVLAKLGHPTAREKPDRLYPGYAYTNCTMPCVERLWYENLIPGLEAWSVSLDGNGRVLESYHWASP
ncbi:hypothetical protein HB780_30755 [Rhizobium lusitanum]|uniref:hypothetical protein n=1 Tax=Rhizobium lusitanum TaxID=293958 RepID=UPI0016186532|nr:hypothetical protein [Rhizobium lusitanum]QND49853.1 hypothetical protein HB780_30755 [Rhizobium lusitanum]